MTTRREFLTSILAAGLGVSVLPNFARAQVDNTAEHIVYVFLTGGLSHIDSFDPKTDEKVKGKFNPIESIVPGIQLNQHLGKFAKHTDKACIVRSLKINTASHEAAQYLTRTSYSRLGSIIHPTINSWVVALSKEDNNLIKNVIINPPSDYSYSGWMDKKFSPIPILDPEKGLAHSKINNVASFDKRIDILNNLNKLQAREPNQPSEDYVKFYDETIKLLRGPELGSFDLNKENVTIREKYGKNKFGQACLLARRLIQAKTKFIEINLDGFDTHSENFSQLEQKLPIIDTAISALIEDLQENGLLSKTLIVIATEFGRTPTINNNKGGGRDHFATSFSSVLIGAGIKGGTVYGVTNEQGNKTLEKECPIQDFNATIAAAGGLPWDKELVSSDGRPFKISDKGTPIQEILA